MLQKEQMLFQSRLDTANAQIEELKTKITELEKKNDNLEDNIGVLKEALNKALAKIDEAKAAIKVLINF